MDKSVKIGVKIISIIFFFMALFPIIGGGWTAYDAADVILNSKTDYAAIKFCEKRLVISFTGSIKGNYRRGMRAKIKPAYFAIAETDSGLEVSSRFPNNKREKCEDKIGNKVSVYVYKSYTENSRINTFIQFWILPIGGSLICMIFSYVILRGTKWFFKY